MRILPDKNGTTHEVLAAAVDNLATFTVDQVYEVTTLFVKRADGSFDFGTIAMVARPNTNSFPE